MKVIADKANNRVSVFLEKANDSGKLIEQNILQLFSFETNEAYSFTAEKTGEEIRIDYSFEKEKLFSCEAASFKAQEVLKYLSAFIDFIFSAQTENKLVCYDSVLFDGENFKLIDSPVLSNPEKGEIIRDFISAFSENSPEFDQALKTELTDACQKAQPEELANIIDRHQNPGKYMIKVCPGCGLEYEFEANFCLKCGSKLEAKAVDSSENIGFEEDFETQAPVKEEPKDYESEPSSSSESEEQTFREPEQEQGFGETTLLGFTNFGETSVLGGQASSFSTPNLVRNSTGEKVFITKRNFIIGKSVDSADFVINNNAVSRTHAEITAIGNEYYIKDKNSTNHTYVNNQILSPEEAKQIFEGDEIKLADESLIFHLY